KRFSAPQAFDWRKPFSVSRSTGIRLEEAVLRSSSIRLGSAGLTLMKSEQPGAESRGQTDGLDDASNINIGPDHQTHVRDDKKYFKNQPTYILISLLFQALLNVLRELSVKPPAVTHSYTCHQVSATIPQRNKA
uniref:Phosphofurin acidic cluster sorting protein 2 n=1 Tax=Macrostomum lignano TaxID=282301 RepID=A0A1I8FA21_9PLAT